MSEQTSRATGGDDDEHLITVEEVPLPGIGVRHDFLTRGGRRVGVLSRRGGRRDLLVYDSRDPDSCSETLALTREEADALGELLATPLIVERLATLREQIEGLVSEQLAIAPGSPFAGRTLGDTQARTRTGASIVAVLRGGSAIPSPGPEFRFEAGDGVVVVGTAQGVEAVAQILTG
jgi:TrkA domain protein